MNRKVNQESGIVLLSTIFMLAVIATMIATFYKVSKVEIASTYSNRQSVNGFYAAEGGLNMRAAEIKATFDGYNLPSGTSPTSTTPCEGGDNGTGDFACKTYTLNNHTVTTFMVEDPGNPQNLTIPPGELYENLNASEYAYTVRSVAKDKNSKITAQLDLGFKSRLVPLFQFLAFYDKDLEIYSAPQLVTEGPIHANGDIYFRSNTGGIFLNSNVTTTEDFYIGLKSYPTNCSGSSANIHFPDPSVPNPVAPGDFLAYDNCHLVGGRIPERPQSDFDPYNGMVKLHVPEITLPPVDSFDPTPGKVFWDKADLRLILKMTTANLADTSVYPTGIEVRTASNAVDVGMTNDLNGCTGSLPNGKAIDNSLSLYDLRESPDGTQQTTLLEVDMAALLDCLHSTSFLGSSNTLDDTTDGGLVMYMTIEGPNSSLSQTFYGIRIQNATELQSGLPGAATVEGLSIVSDQAVYTKGDFNSVNKIPAAIMADIYVLLSDAWDDADSNEYLEERIASNTTVNAALIYGSDTTCANTHSWPEGEPCWPSTDGGEDSTGGFANHIRYLEAWTHYSGHFNTVPPHFTQRLLTYRGSAVSLGNPRRNSGRWIFGTQKPSYSHVPTDYRGQYLPQARDFKYDQDFNNVDNLPPLTPRFVYLKQELFVRDYDQ